MSFGEPMLQLVDWHSAAWAGRSDATYQLAVYTTQKNGATYVPKWATEITRVAVEKRVSAMNIGRLLLWAYDNPVERTRAILAIAELGGDLTLLVNT